MPVNPIGFPVSAKAKHLRREGTRLDLLFASLTGIIGSGWLLGPMLTARIAGPYAGCSWILGGILVASIALCYAELGPLVPKAGAAIHIGRMGNGAILAMIWTWLLFLGYVANPPAEVFAIVTYANNYVPGLLQPHTILLSFTGFVVSAVLLLGIATLNLQKIRIVLTLNKMVTWMKLMIPLITIMVFLLFSVHTSNLHVDSSHRVFYLQGMFSAIATTGIVYSYLGFRQAIELGGEAKKPWQSIPFGVLVSVVIAILVYVGLQYAFLLGVNPRYLHQQSWSTIQFPGINGPFAAIAQLLGFTWLSYLLYVDAVLSPGGTAVIGIASTSRILIAISEAYKSPKILSYFKYINQNGVPIIAVLFVAGVEFLFFLPFPSWQRITTYIASLDALSYGIGPIVLLQLRRAAPDFYRPFRLWGAPVIAPFAFTASNLIIFWSGMRTLNFLFGLLAILMGVALTWIYGHLKSDTGNLGWRYSWWLFPYFSGMWILTKMGPAIVEGMGLIPLYWDMGMIVIFSLVIMKLALHCAVPHTISRHYLESFSSESIARTNDDIA